MGCVVDDSQATNVLSPLIVNKRTLMVVPLAIRIPIRHMFVSIKDI